MGGKRPRRARGVRRLHRTVALRPIAPTLVDAGANKPRTKHRHSNAKRRELHRQPFLPLSLPGLIYGCLLVYSLSISALVTPALMGNARERMVGQQIYDEVLVSFNWPSASSLALTLVLLTVGLMFCALFATRHASRQERAR
jgi:ABC-type spermidine/putrescine transport system permease subunit I